LTKSRRVKSGVFMAESEEFGSIGG